MNIGNLGVSDCYNFGLTGVLARSTGLKRDLRLSTLHNYSSYNTLVFRSFIGINGDTYDRYLIRMLEMGESLNIVNITVSKLLYLSTNTNKIKLQNKLLHNHYVDNNLNYTSMEDLILHFIN
ncbi:MAG: hypothetical protein KDH96_08690 [Candidatus Riesia sp.]|nr:hypothetical protein [Candidatus Riesia sp.]